MKLKLSEPKVVTFWIAVILAVLGILAFLGTIPGLSSYAFWLVAAGFVLLALANLIERSLAFWMGDELFLIEKFAPLQGKVRSLPLLLKVVQTAFSCDSVASQCFLTACNAPHYPYIFNFKENKNELCIILKWILLGIFLDHHRPGPAWFRPWWDIQHHCGYLRADRRCIVHYQPLNFKFILKHCLPPERLSCWWQFARLCQNKLSVYQTIHKNQENLTMNKKLFESKWKQIRSQTTRVVDSNE